MNRYRRPPTRLLARLACAAGMSLGAAAAAMAAPADYRCADGQVLTVDFTPRTAQAHLGTQAWTLQRVRSGREARYVGRDGVAIVLNRSDAELHRRDMPPLACRLVVRALDAGAAPRPAR